MTETTVKTVSVVGLGKLGSTMVGCFASKGFKVIGVDINKDFVDKINKGKSPVVEPDLSDLIENFQKNIKATTDFNEAVVNSDITFVIVPTPSDETGGFSTRYVEEAMNSIGKALKNKHTYHTVVLTSTVLPGSVEAKILPVLESSSGKSCNLHFGFCYSPLFIALGSVVKNILNPDMVLIGQSDEKAGKIVEEFYKNTVDNKPAFVRMNYVNAELTKISVNSYITTKISFANVIGQICENLPGSNADVVTNALGFDTRIGSKYLKAGLGFGGPCFPRDNKAFISVAKNAGSPAPLAEITDQINGSLVDRLIKRMQEAGEEIKTVAVLGLSYKPDTPVMEESQGLQIAVKLAALGHKVVAYDPMIGHIEKSKLGKSLIIAGSLYECISGADAIIITLPYPEFIFRPEDLNGKSPVIIDCWRILDPKRFRGKVTYLAVGMNEDPLNFNKLRKMKVAVCGAGGFIGGNMVADLLRKGYTNIRSIDIKPVKNWHQSFKESENLQLDLRLKEDCNKALEDTDLVYNFAADMGGMGFIENNRAFCMINVLINTHLLQSAVANKVKRFFFASSACIYPLYKQDKPDLPALKESDAYPALPEDGYGWEKLFSERMCRNFREDFGLQTRIARFHNIYGPFGIFQGGREKAPAAICRKVIEAKLSGTKRVEIWGDGNQARSFTYIEDCIKGSQELLLSDITEPINIGSSEKVTINQLVDLVEKIAGIKLERNYNLSAPRGVNGRNSDNTLIKELLNWEPSVSLKEGLQKTYNWIYEKMAGTKNITITRHKPRNDVKKGRHTTHTNKLRSKHIPTVSKFP